MRTLITLSTLLLAMLTGTVRAQLLIDGRPAAFDEQSHVWLACVPEQMFGQTCCLSVGCDGKQQQIIIDGETIDGQHTFADITAQRMYPAMLSMGQGRVVAGIIMFTFLPTVQLWGHFSSTYTDGRLLVTESRQRQPSDTIALQAKWRGGTTGGAEKNKHNYRLKLKRNARFFGLRNDDNWILDAGQIDVLRLRNRIATDLWNDFATPPYYADEEPEARSGARGQAVELFLNGAYWGIYNMMENMDRKQMQLMKQTEHGGEVHGAMWRSNGYGIAMMNWTGNVPATDNQSETWDTFEAKYPDLHDSDTIDWHTLSQAIRFVSRSHNDEFNEQIATYFDLPVVIDNFIFNNVLLALDNNSKNLVWAVYDKQTDRRLTCAVWDLDCTAGQRWLERVNRRFSSPEYPLATGTQLIDRLLKLDTGGFRQTVIDRYHELRRSAFHIDSLKARYAACVDMLKKSGAAQREVNRWSGDTDLDGRVIDFDDELQYISTWFERRLTYLDGIFTPQRILSAIHSTSQQAQSDGGAIYSLTGQKMPGTEQSLRPGIYLRDGRKIIVR